MNTRAASYLQLLLKNPGVWVRIKKAKPKGKLVPSRQNSAERRDTYEDIVTSLKIMSIPHEVGASGEFKILIKHESRS